MSENATPVMSDDIIIFFLVLCLGLWLVFVMIKALTPRRPDPIMAECRRREALERESADFWRTLAMSLAHGNALPDAEGRERFPDAWACHKRKRRSRKGASK